MTWEVAYENEANDYFREWLAIMAGTETVAQTPPRRKITDEDRANAPILAAAPELRTALQDIIDEANDTSVLQPYTPMDQYYRNKRKRIVEIADAALGRCGGGGGEEGVE